jgi:uncharacterized membrane protein YeaQ/YmgE (transglycosylase-associated protein family)
MSKIVAGLLFGLILGAIDGGTAWFYPEARPLWTSIMIGSSIKGMIVGLFSGWFARKVQSTGWGIVVGSALGLVFAFLVAAMDATKGKPHYLEIMLPGFVVGGIIGFLTQKIGTAPLANKGTQ